MLGRLKKADKKPAPDAPVKIRPKRNCPRCYGRGILGTRPDGGVVLCACVFRASANQATVEEAWSEYVKKHGSGGGDE